MKDIGTVLAVAGFTALFCARFKFPLVLGYLIAGVLISPHSPVTGVVRDMQSVNALSDMGVTFLLFVIGLEFQIYKIREQGARTLVVSLVELAFMFCVGMTLGSLLGWKPLASAFLAGMLMISSTLIIVGTLSSKKLTTGRPAKFAMNLAIYEDLAAVLLIFVLGTLVAGKGVSPKSLAKIAFDLSLFLATTLIAGLVIVPRVLNRLFKGHQHEALSIVTLGLCFGFALFSASLGYSPALGAFIMGLIAAESLSREWLLNRLEPMREFFTALFFVSMGALFDYQKFIEHWQTVLIVLLVFVPARVAAVALGSFVSGRTWRLGLQTGFCMAVLGEFSFILASLGERSGVLGSEIHAIMVSVCLGSAIALPFNVGRAGAWASKIEAWLPGPVKSFFALYESRITAPKDTGTSSRWWKLLHRPLMVLVLEFVVLSAIAATSGPFVAWLKNAPIMEELLPGSSEWVGWLLVIAAALPFLVASWKNMQVIGMIAAELGLSSTPSLKRRMENALAQSLTAALALAALLWLGLITRPFLPPWPVLAILATLGAGVAVFFWQGLNRLHHRVESVVRVSLANAALSQKGRLEARQVLEEQYPVQASIKEIVLLPDSDVVGRALKDIMLRENTGATILAIKRSGFELVNPPADTCLFPEDHLLLVGDAEQIRIATEFFSITRVKQQEEKNEIWVARLRENSAVLGSSLRQSGLRSKTGVTVVGLIRGGVHHASPAPDTSLNDGDGLLIFGPKSALTKAVEVLGAERVSGG